MPGRSYVMYRAVAAGGMASVHVGKLLAPGGFSRRVAIKRLHPELAADPEIVAAFADEARHAARIAHVNVVAMLDVVSADGELFLVMDYVHGESLSRLLKAARSAGEAVPIPTVVAVLADVLHGLHAAHEATDESGARLDLVHRDVSPQNVIVGVDGVARVVDFGIAKALARAHVTRDGAIRGKMPYMAPEQLLHQPIDRRVDVYAAGVLLHEALTGARLFEGDDEAELFQRIAFEPIAPPSRKNARVPKELDAIVMRALERDPERRFATAREMALAVEAAAPRAPASAVGDWVAAAAKESLAKRAALVADMERDGRADERGLPAVRAPSASVIFREAPETPPEASAANASRVVVRAATPAPSPVNELPTVVLGPVPRRRKRAIVVATAVAGTAVLAVLAVLAVASASAPPAARTMAAPPPIALPPAAPELPEPPASAPAARPPPTSTAAASSPPAAATPARATAAAAAPTSTRWCKVFDPDKQIYVLKAMRVAQCP